MTVVSAPTARRCRRRPRTPGHPRPSDLLSAFFAAAATFLIAGAVVGVYDTIGDWALGHWLGLHLMFVGGISQLVIGAGQFFAGAFLATAPPSRQLVGLQLASWNCGTVLVAIGVTTHTEVATTVGAALLLVGLAAFAGGLRSMRGRSLQRMPWAVRWYLACAAFLGMGVVIGVALASSVRWSAGSLLGAHLSLNLAGWFGTAIVGTLHTFFPSLTQTRLRYGRLQAPTFGFWVAGTVMLASGFAFGLDPMISTGWVALAVAAALLCANLIASLAAGTGTPALPALLIATGQVCLVAALTVTLTSVIAGDPTSALFADARGPVAILVLPGWLGLTVAGSLLHLLAVLGRVRDLRRPIPVALPLRDWPLVAVAVLGIALASAAHGGLLSGARDVSDATLIAIYVVLAAMILRRGVTALRPPSRPAPNFPQRSV